MFKEKCCCFLAKFKVNTDKSLGRIYSVFSNRFLLALLELPKKISYHKSYVQIRPIIAFYISAA